MALCVKAKEALAHYIAKIEKFNKYEWNLEFYGSTVSGLISPTSSDIDLTLIVSQKTKKEVAGVFHPEVLELIKLSLPYKRYSTILMKMKRLYCLRITDNKLKINIDLCINNILGIVNSQMLRTYCLIDRRFQEMCLLLKMVHEDLKPFGS